jgi:hypothetical protein
MLDEKSKERYSACFNSFKRSFAYSVHGIMISNKTLYVLKPYVNVFSFGLYDASLFEVIDDRISSDWSFKYNCSSCYLFFDNFDFSKYNCLGFPDFIHNLDFFKEFWDDDVEHRRWVEKLSL